MRERTKQHQKEELEAQIALDSALSNLQYVQTKLSEESSLQEYLAETGKTITLARKTSFVYIPPPPGLYFGFPAAEFPSSRIVLDARGIAIKHKLRAIFSSGPFTGESYIDSPLTPETLNKLWRYDEARSLIRAFARLKPEQILRRVSKVIG